MAAHYVDLIRTVQPEGPYHLYGWSVGGLFAFEIACQLEAAGATVGLLAVGDTSAPGRSVQPRVKTVWQKIGWHRAFLSGVGLTASVGYLARLAARTGMRRVDALTGWGHQRVQRDWQAIQSALDVGAPAPPGLMVDYLERWTMGLALQYVPERNFGGDLLFLRAEESWGSDGWEQLVGGRIHVVDVPGFHTEFHRDPGRARVGQLLGDAIRSASS
jgi:thioesterase domain-containing protein